MVNISIILVPIFVLNWASIENSHDNTCPNILVDSVIFTFIGTRPARMYLNQNIHQNGTRRLARDVEFASYLSNNSMMIFETTYFTVLMFTLIEEVEGRPQRGMSRRV